MGLCSGLAFLTLDSWQTPYVNQLFMVTSCCQGKCKHLATHHKDLALTALHEKGIITLRTDVGCVLLRC